jgi:proteasome lid subunit RPN8/RPN11
VVFNPGPVFFAENYELLYKETFPMLPISFAIYSEMLAHCRESSPIEACGYLAAKEGTIVRLFRMTNTDRSREHFSMDPAEQFQALKTMRQAGLSLAAVYHSHPDTPARPSDEDVKLAYDQTIAYVIISLLPGAEDIKCYTIQAGLVGRKEIVVLRQDSAPGPCNCENKRATNS